MLGRSSFAADADYRLGPGDMLRVNVFGSPELSGEVRVSESGNITYPLVGQVPVSGKSPTQVEALLVDAFVEELGRSMGRPAAGVSQEAPEHARVARRGLSHDSGWGSEPRLDLTGGLVGRHGGGQDGGVGADADEGEQGDPRQPDRFAPGKGTVEP